MTEPITPTEIATETATDWPTAELRVLAEASSATS